MDIATNAVFAAILLDIAAAVNPLELPLGVPLDPAKVRYFHVGPDSAGSDRLSSVLFYEGGYKFWHAWGIMHGFETTNAYTTLQDPRQIYRLVGKVYYSEAECLAKFKSTMGALGHTNLSILDHPPRVRGPIDLEGKVVPRYIFEWPDPQGRLQDWMSVVRVEVNATTLRIEFLELLAEDFKREGLPLTYGKTDPLAPPTPAPKVVRTELEVADVSRDYAMALIRHILPQIEEFGRKFGPPLNLPMREADIVMGESKVCLQNGRILASLRHPSGYQVIYYKGRIATVNTEDVYSNHGSWEEHGRLDIEENRDPMRFTREQATEKVRRLLVDRFGLPEKPLYLDTKPQFYYAPRLDAAKGVRRYVFCWSKPETKEERENRLIQNRMADISILAEVDAVSGTIKLLSFMHPSLNRPEPVLEVPVNARE
ncbi:MAG: hypothetical protein KJ072_16080 [Verrucomicrobia bacterium]|nr:hypothetical protein [Verrucomicrobiota bacterium]